MMKTVKEFEERLAKDFPDLCRELRDMRRSKTIKVITLSVVVCAMTALTMPEMKTLYMKIAACIFAFVVCFLIGVFVPPQKVFWGKRRIGVIEEIKVRSHVFSQNGAGVRRLGASMRTVATASMRSQVCYDLVVRFEGEETRKRGRVLCLPQKYGKCFEKGDRILQYEPLAYPVLLDTEGRKRLFCHSCGAVMKNGERRCTYCNQKLLRFETDLWAAFED